MKIRTICTVLALALCTLTAIASEDIDYDFLTEEAKKFLPERYGRQEVIQSLKTFIDERALTQKIPKILEFRRLKNRTDDFALIRDNPYTSISHDFFMSFKSYLEYTRDGEGSSERAQEWVNSFEPERREMYYANDAYGEYKKIQKYIFQDVMDDIKAHRFNEAQAQKYVSEHLLRRYREANIVGLLENAALKSSTKAQLELAGIYFNGELVTKSVKEYKYWLKKAAKLYENKLLRNADAMAQLAGEYRSGENFEKSEDDFWYWVEQAGDHGNAQAAEFMMNAYASGTHVEKSMDKAASYLKYIAIDEQWGYIDELIRALATGKVRFLENANHPKDEETVKMQVRNFKSAADQGHPVGLMMMAGFYEDGIGVEKSLSKAKELYQKASDAGVKAANAKLESLK